jgi:Zn-dependent M28 family amino/carboxypeptidase
MRRILALVLTLALASPVAADPLDTAKKLVASALSDRWGYDLLEGLTTEIGPRLAGTDSARRAAEWSAAKLKAAGFDDVRIEEFPMTAWVRGVERARIVAPAPQPLVITTLGGSVATPAGGITADIALFKTLDDMLQAAPGALAGRIAVVTQRQTRFLDGTGYGAANPVRRAGPSEAARRGAVAYLHRSLGTSNHRLAHTGALNYKDDAPKIPAAALSNPDADQLERLAARGSVTLELNLTPLSIGGEKGQTVVAEIKGRDRPDEIVLVGAHLDSWDLGTGAIDDGAGVAIVSAAARLIGQLSPHPRRTIRVVLFGAEEMNVSGPAYAAAHGEEAHRIVVASESDFGARRVVQVLLPRGAARSAFARDLSRVLTPLGIVKSLIPATMAGSDVAPLVRKGVPPLALRQNGIDYFDIHHTADDTLDKVDPAELAQAIAAWAAYIYLAADSDVDFRALAAAAPEQR